jgi:hypothetical protein
MKFAQVCSLIVAVLFGVVLFWTLLLVGLNQRQFPVHEDGIIIISGASTGIIIILLNSTQLNFTYFSFDVLIN